MGQNLAKMTGNVNVNQMVARWVSEKAYYDYMPHSCGRQCANYRQMVWERTTRVRAARMRR